MQYLIVDAFTSTPFAGNPAAVVPLLKPLPDDLMQSLAAEFNLAETAFALRISSNTFELRWFTPTREVPLCGHATLAAAHALWQLNLVPPTNTIYFQTRTSGALACVPQIIDNEPWIQMDFPATLPEPAPLPPDAAKILKIDAPVTCVGVAPMNLTLRLPHASHVRDCKPDLAALAAWHPIGVIITAPGDEPGIDFVSRFFAPAAGVPEDPVTGSAHCSLVPYWHSQTQRTTFTSKQLSHRSGLLRLEYQPPRVLISGQAVTTMQGSLHTLPHFSHHSWPAEHAAKRPVIHEH